MYRFKAKIEKNKIPNRYIRTHHWNNPQCFFLYLKVFELVGKKVPYFPKRAFIYINRQDLIWRQNNNNINRSYDSLVFSSKIQNLKTICCIFPDLFLYHSLQIKTIFSKFEKWQFLFVWKHFFGENKIQHTRLYFL